MTAILLRPSQPAGDRELRVRDPEGRTEPGAGEAAGAPLAADRRFVYHPPVADEQDFPTAIVPTRPGTAVERYDDFAAQFGDPMATLFVVQATSPFEENRIRAASELLPYRYPKLKVSEVRFGGAAPGAVNIQINIGSPSAADPRQSVVGTPAAVDPLS